MKATAINQLDEPDLFDEEDNWVNSLEEKLKPRRSKDSKNLLNQITNQVPNQK